MKQTKDGSNGGRLTRGRTTDRLKRNTLLRGDRFKKGMLKGMFEGVCRAEEGQVLVLAPILILIGLLLLGLVADVGNLFLTQYRMQAATDAAALAADEVFANGYGTNQAQVVSTANRFMQLNGFPTVKYDLANPSSENQIQISPSNYQVQLSFTQAVPTFFMSLLGIHHVNITVHSHAQDSSAFNYALFANQQLDLTSENFTIQGSLHSNGGINISGSRGAIAGRIGYAGSATPTYTYNMSSFGQQTLHTTSIPMPVFNLNQLRAKAKQANQYYSSSQTVSGLNVTFSPNSVLYVDGNIYLDAEHYSGSATLVATGSIYINGNSFTQETANQGLAALYAGQDIIVNKPSQVNGILYAPNGTVSVQQNNLVLNGSIVANQISLDGNHISVCHQSGSSSPGFHGMPVLVN